MFFGVLFLLWVCVAGIQCDLKSLQDQVLSLKVDSGSQSIYWNLLQQLEQCDDVKKFDLEDHIHYRLGLIHLIENQEWKAVGSFEKVREDQGSISQSAGKHLHNLYLKFGIWDKLENGDAKDHYLRLNSSNVQTIENLNEMLEIAPYDYHARSLMRVELLNKLKEELDVSTGQEFVSNSEVILEKHTTRLSLAQRLSLHYEAAVIQMLVVNSMPTHLRKCLAVDMDYEPCKRLTLFNTRLGKINPPRSRMLDPEMYAFGDESIDWNKVVNFYFRDKKPCTKLPSGYKFENNYKLIERVVQESLQETIGDLQGKRSDFLKFMDSVLCQAGSQAPNNKKLTSTTCKKLVKDVLTAEEHKEVHKAAIQGEQLPEDLLEKLWNSSPNVAMYVVEGIMSKAGKRSTGLQDQIANFFKQHKLSNSNNKYVRTQLNSINNIMHQRQQQDQQRQRQQQEWYFRQQQQQQQRYQPPPPPLHTDKDYYKILNIPKNANAKEIRKAYLNFTKMYHPDKQGQLSEEQQKKNDEKMSEINEAYETLSDEGKRREYDMARSGQYGGGGGGGMPHGGGGMFGGGGNPFQFNQNFKFNFGF
ncbi:hypothetical protein ZYGR_0AD06590 [Zygosaccharomyces rouxii]|uniref:J domain-containing protein n=1 Tax=Zygosaccharomyces rouxii TaxID=4956 RepID=A0A1Q3A6V8_ZYGRO|nr:hypothetical protein ZYGR_0AD06590 [Zygosaccharomyces rouxii]